MKKQNTQTLYNLLVIVLTSIATISYSQNSCDQNIKINKQEVLGAKDYLIIRTNFVDGDVDKGHNKSQLETYMTALDGYIKKLSYNKTWVGNYEITPIYQSTLTSSDIKRDLDKISIEMKRLASEGGYKVNDRLVYLIFDAPDLDIGNGGAFGGGNGTSGTTWWPAKLPFVASGFIHETFHMFGVGHLGLIETENNSSYPGNYNVGGLDPYHFMGTEGGFSNWDANSPAEGHSGPIPIGNKFRLGWLENDNFIAISGTKTRKERIYLTDGTGDVNGKKIGIIVDGYKELYTIAYHKNLIPNQRLDQEGGVLVHEFRGSGLAHTYLLDAHPNSVEGSPDPARQTDAWKSAFEFSDAAIKVGEEMIVGELFTVKVESEGGSGNDRWVDISIIPKINCLVEPEGLTMEDFEYSSNGEKCKKVGLVTEWEILDKDIPQVTLKEESLEYKNLSFQGGSLQMESIDDDSYVISTKLKKTFCSGDFWLSFLIKTDKLANGHIFVMPNNNFDIAVGKKWGDNFAINNTFQKRTRIIKSETALVVAKYELKEGKDNVYLWVDPNLEKEPQKSEATAIKEGVDDIGIIGDLTINKSGNGKGIFSFDRIVVADNYLGLFNNESTLSISNIDKIDKKQDKIKVYPTYFKDFLNIEGLEGQNEISMFNVFGSRVLKQKNIVKGLDTKSLLKGIYFLNIKQGSKYQIFKVIK